MLRARIRGTRALFIASHFIPVLLVWEPTPGERVAHLTFMALLEEKSENKPLVDVLDRIFDKGIVMDARTRLSLMDARLQPAGTRVVVASPETRKTAA